MQRSNPITNREIAEKLAIEITELTRFCLPLHKNDIQPDIEQALNEAQEEQRKKINGELERIHTPNKRGGWSCKHCTGYADDDVVCYRCIAKAIEGQT